MKITFVCPVISLAGGIRVVAIYAARLRAMGHEVSVIAPIPPNPSLKKRINDGVRGRPRPLIDDTGRLAYFDGLEDCLHEIERDGPLLPEQVPDGDVIIATWWRTAFEVATLPPQKGRKFYFVQGHEVFPNLPWDLSAGSYYLPLKKITIAGWLVDTMADRYGDVGVPMVPNSVDTDQFFAPPRQKNPRPTIGFMYSKGHPKGVDVSLEAIKIARDHFPDLKIVSFGGMKPVPEQPIPEDVDVVVKPSQEDIRNLYAQCDVWLCGSRSEGFHLPPLEAMACRTPVVGTRVGGVVETVTEGVNGYTAQIEDSATLGQRLIDVLSQSPEDWKTMSEAAHTRAHAWSWDDAARAFEAILTDTPTGSD